MDTKDRSTASHPTIVVGFGAFGLEVMRRVLLMTASRGALTYEEPRAGDDPSSRRLRDLVLLHVDPRRDRRPEDDAAGSFEMMNDLYRQIGPVEGPADFVAAMRVASTRLLSAAERAVRRDRLRLGLDVIVVAQPTYRDLTQMEELLRPAMDELAARPNLARPGQGADRVNFVQILDFDHFWDSSQPARDLRRFLRSALERWDERRREGKSTFRRTYLLDRHAESGDRDQAFRVDEVALFLELLLFEGRRDAEQDLFQPRNDDAPPLCAFGVRAFERSAGLVTRLAAARFGAAWLEYLARPDVGGAVRLSDSLAEYTRPALRERFGGAFLGELAASGIAGIERSLAAIPPSDARFRERAGETLRGGCEDLLDRLSARLAEHSREWASGPARDLRARLSAAVDEALHGRDPASVTAVAEAVRAFASDVDPSAEPRVTAPPLGMEGTLEDLSNTIRAYDRFAAQQVRTAELPRFWILLCALLAAGLAPALVRAIRDAGGPDPTDTFRVYAFQALQLAGHPVVLPIVLFGVFLAATLGVLQRSARLASRRALDFHVDPERGRLADAVRRLLAEGSPLRGAIEATLRAGARKAEISARSEVHRELVRVHERLAERARELSWARSQLRELLKIHGIDPAASGPSATGRASLGPVRSSSRLDAKIHAALAATPLTDQRFQEAQRAVKPFEGWDARHEGSLLLFPLRLVDRLSESYRDPLEAELAQRGPAREHEALAQDLVGFMDAQRDFSIGFLWSARADERTHPTDHLCFLPAIWSALPSVGPALARHALDGRTAFFDGRAYLLKVTLGVALEQLGEAT